MGLGIGLILVATVVMELQLIDVSTESTPKFSLTILNYHFAQNFSLSQYNRNAAKHKIIQIFRLVNLRY